MPKTSNYTLATHKDHWSVSETTGLLISLFDISLFLLIEYKIESDNFNLINKKHKHLFNVCTNET